jgi:hypothetical protein
MDITLKLPVPEHMLKKVNAIKAVRALTGLGLKEAKAVTDELQTGEPQKITVNAGQHDRQEHYDTLRSNGIQIMEMGNTYVREIRNLLIRTLKNGDYSIAEEVLALLKTVDGNGR